MAIVVKKLIGSVISILSVCVILILGCIFLMEKNEELAKEQTKQLADVIWQETSENIDSLRVRQEENYEQDIKDIQDIQNIQDIQYGVIRSQLLRAGYAYDTLAVDEQIVYEEILNGLLEMQEETTVSTLDERTLERVFACVMNDHPEIFYVDGYTYTKYTVGDELTKLSFQGNMIYSPEEIKLRQESIEHAVSEIFARMPYGMDEYETVKFFYEYIINHTEYATDAPDNQNICSVLLEGRSVCQGYAKALQYLLLEAGQEAALVTGVVSNGEGHAWNLVRMDGDWYYVDATFGDASYQMGEGSHYEMGEVPSIDFSYLGVTTKELSRTHHISDTIPMPECSAMKDNYYIREGAYFTEIDSERIRNYIASGEVARLGFAAFKCSDDLVYEQMCEYLLVQQKIFDYIDPQDGVLAYYESSNQNIIGVWLP